MQRNLQLCDFSLRFFLKAQWRVDLRLETANLRPEMTELRPRIAGGGMRWRNRDRVHFRLGRDEYGPLWANLRCKRDV